MIELLLVLGIVAVIIVMATRYYGQAKMGQHVNAALQNVQAMYAACTKYRADVTNATCSMAVLTQQNYLPANFDGGKSNVSAANPWGGNASVGKGPDGTVAVTLTGVPNDDCSRLVKDVAATMTTGQSISSPDWSYGEFVSGLSCGQDDDSGSSSPTFNF